MESGCGTVFGISAVWVGAINDAPCASMKRMNEKLNGDSVGILAHGLELCQNLLSRLPRAA
jgi:hypothetical protein